MKIDFKTAMHRLMDAEDVLILTHANPDGDTLGGAFALALALRQRGKRAKVLCADGVPQRYAFLAVPPEEDFAERYIVTIDVADRMLLGKTVEESYGDRVDLAIDHHGTTRLFAKESYVEPDSASACEIVYLLLLSMGVHITKEIADRLYAGVSTDTGCFCYSNVTARTHRIAADLLDRGADVAGINVLMFETKKPGFLQLEQQVLQGMQLFENGRISLLTITRAMLEETGCRDEEIDPIVALSRQVEGVRIGITFKERPDGSWKVSVRTHDGVDAAQLCAQFGGGGHKRAAGCQFESNKDAAALRMLEAARALLL